MLRKTTLVIFLLSALAVAVGAITFPPVEERKTSRHYELHIKETHRRYWQVLPPEGWGFTPVKTITRGVYEGGTIHTRRFGFIGLTEYDQTVYTKDKK